MMTRRFLGLLLLTGVSITAVPALARLAAQDKDKAPIRREFSIVAKDYRFSPERIEVTQDDILKLTVKSEDVAYGLTIDRYRVQKRVPAGGAVTFELRADQVGEFDFYSNMTNDPRHQSMKGKLIVRGR